MKVPTGLKYLKEAIIPRLVYESDRIINLANIKTHGQADFSMGMKLMMGFLHPWQRRDLHQEHLQEKISELGSVIRPDVTIIDGRTMFITGGPDEGQVCDGDRVFVCDDWLAADLAAYGHLYKMKAKHNCVEHFSHDPSMMRQFRRFDNDLMNQLGSMEWNSI